MTIAGEAALEDPETRVRAPAPRPSQRRSRRLGRWSELTREVAIVVTGILIAFSLDAWWGARCEMLSQEAQLRALHQEFTANRERIDQAEERHRLDSVLPFTDSRTLLIKYSHTFARELRR